MIGFVRRALPYLLLAPALLPLVYFDGLLYPYVAPKTFLFRGLGIVMFAAFTLLALSGQPFFWERLRQKLTWIPAALLAVAYATSLMGVDFYHSFWSIYDRGDGLLTLTVAVLFFYVTLLYADRGFCRGFQIAHGQFAFRSVCCSAMVSNGYGNEFPIIERQGGSAVRLNGVSQVILE